MTQLLHVARLVCAVVGALALYCIFTATLASIVLGRLKAGRPQLHHPHSSRGCRAWTHGGRARPRRNRRGRLGEPPPKPANRSTSPSQGPRWV